MTSLAKQTLAQLHEVLSPSQVLLMDWLFEYQTREMQEEVGNLRTDVGTLRGVVGR